MTTIRFQWKDVAAVKRLESAMGQLSGSQIRLAEARAVNRVGDMAKTQIVRALAKQTGLRSKVIRKAVRVKRATKSTDGIEYIMVTEGGDISLKYFKARETRAGVSAAPFGKRQLFGGTFMKGGRMSNRVVAKGLKGHVYQRDGAERNPISLLKSGVIIPEQMVKGDTVSIFNATVATHLPRRAMHEIERLVPGIFN